jgi:hypothetical protein
MGLFGNILGKLGIGRAPATPTPPTAAPEGASVAAGAGETVGTVPPPPTSIPVVDVVAQLEQRAASSPQKLNWRTSIVDLLKLLDLDSSLAARKELATELGCPDDLTKDSAKMNMWLHKAVLARIAENGGNVPKELLH